MVVNVPAPFTRTSFEGDNTMENQTLASFNRFATTRGLVIRSATVTVWSRNVVSVTRHVCRRDITIQFRRVGPFRWVEYR